MEAEGASQNELCDFCADPEKSKALHKQALQAYERRKITEHHVQRRQAELAHDAEAADEDSDLDLDGVAATTTAQNVRDRIRSSGRVGLMTPFRTVAQQQKQQQQQHDLHAPQSRTVATSIPLHFPLPAAGVDETGAVGGGGVGLNSTPVGGVNNSSNGTVQPPVRKRQRFMPPRRIPTPPVTGLTPSSAAL
jgi:hypothetical protein